MTDKKKPGVPEQGDIFGDPGLIPDNETSPDNRASDDESASPDEKTHVGGRKEKKSKKGAKAESFEKLLGRLEEIVETMEGGGLPLDEMMKLYEEGVQKAEALTSMLADARTRVMKLVKNANGKPLLEQFEGEESL